MMAQRRLSMIFASALFVTALATLSCGGGKSVRHITQAIPGNASIAVIVNAPNKVKNVVLVRFLAKGFNVKAINANDFYSMNDVFDIRDFKKLSYIGQEDFLAIEKSFNNLFKLHYYNFEVGKAEILAEMRAKWNVQYLILLDLKDWNDGSWGRAIDLKTNELIWVENYPTSFKDSIESVVDHFITSMTKR